jgi:hypothetical protein
MTMSRSSALCLGVAVLLFSAGAASAKPLFGPDPAVRVAVPSVSSQAQLADTLRAQGYSDIRLSAVPADPDNPHPELNRTLTNNPENTPVRTGWNGVAVKDGRTVQIYATRKPVG